MTDTELREYSQAQTLEALDLHEQNNLLRAENERLTAKCASQAAELRQLDEEIQRLKQTITWLTSSPPDAASDSPSPAPPA